MSANVSEDEDKEENSSPTYQLANSARVVKRALWDFPGFPGGFRGTGEETLKYEQERDDDEYDCQVFKFLPALWERVNADERE